MSGWVEEGSEMGEVLVGLGIVVLAIVVGAAILWLAYKDEMREGERRGKPLKW